MSALAVEERGEAVALLTLNRPDKRNAIDRDLFAELIETVERLETDEEIRCAVLTGAPPAFCAGVDLGDASDPELLAERRRSGANPAAVLLGARTPTIAAVNGACVAGGLELALACDYALASTEAVFADTHVQLGLLPSWGASALLPQAVGLRRARYMALTGAKVGATQALEFGLVNELCEPEELLQRALGQARAIAAAPPEKVAALRDVYRRGEGQGSAERLAIERQAVLASPVEVSGTRARRRELGGGDE